MNPRLLQEYIDAKAAFYDASAAFEAAAEAIWQESLGLTGQVLISGPNVPVGPEGPDGPVSEVPLQ